MQQREKMLAALVGCLLVILVGYWLFGKVRTAFNMRSVRIESLNAEIKKKEATEASGRKAAQQLAHWEHRSLPSDRELARTLYQNWLVKLADKNKLANINIDAGRGGMHKNIYYKLPFSVQCRGSLEEAVAFLHDFYSANHLHQLRELSIKPASNARTLDLNFTIEALVLPTADREDALNDEKGERLVHSTFASYRDPIVKRNLFAEYVPPRPPAPQRAPDPPSTPPPAFDASKFAVLTAVLEISGESQAWINVRTTGEILKRRVGEKVKVGDFEATIKQIDTASIELETRGKTHKVALGKSLSSDTATRPEPAATATEATAEEKSTEEKTAEEKSTEEKSEEKTGESN